MSQDSLRNIAIYDTTLRDGSQGEGISFSLQDKSGYCLTSSRVRRVDYIEGGYPMSIEKDAEFFAKARQLDLGSSRICAFGMTRRRQDEPQMTRHARIGRCPDAGLHGRRQELGLSCD